MRRTSLLATSHVIAGLVPATHFTSAPIPKLSMAGLDPATQTRHQRCAAIDMMDGGREPPGNQLEALKHDRKGQWSIRINDQCRLCFRWVNENAEDVEIVDYH